MAGPYIDAAPFLEEAQRVVGAEDWGDDGFEEAYHRFVESLNREAELTDEGAARTRAHVRQLLIGRLGVVRDRTANPAIAREEVRAPLILTGPGRSGTSFFNALIAADQRNHSPLHWQVWHPSPPPALQADGGVGTIAEMERFMQEQGWQAPDVRATHNYTARNAAEDILVLDYSFRSATFAFFWNTPSYGAWLASADLAPAYRFERVMLQALQHGVSRDQWVIKSPVHLGQLGYLFDEFPDARLAVNHRDPVKTLGSISSMLKAHRRQFGNAPVVLDRSYALAAMEGLARSLEDMIGRRKDAAVNARFVDIVYADLIADPLAEVAKFYAHHGIAFTDEARASMQAHIADNRQGKFGVHTYDISETGLRVEEIRERFKFYTDCFDIPLDV
ncbi:MAG TPA: sulfotransferase [Sphingobium sp.]|nr:sulfotransferase [Sphingobium sp.]